MSANNDRITLITGANAGLGHETARQLIALGGHTVYVAARTREKADAAAAELGARPIVIDVTDDATIAAAAAQIENEHGRLDVLVNNAGVGDHEVDGKVVREPLPPAEITGDRFAAVLATNVVGIVRMMHAFVPLLQRSDNGVVANVGSGLGAFGRILDPERFESKVRGAMPYSTSKAAVSMLTIQYAREYPGLRINVVGPGPTATRANANSGFQSVDKGAAHIVRAATIGPDGPTGTFLDASGISPW